MKFVTPDMLAKIPKMSPAEMDGLPFGLVGLTDDGKIVKYNKFQSDLASVPQATAMGKSFFKEIAPCTQNPIFSQQFETGVKAGKLDLVFPYTFTYKMKPTNVTVHMYRDAGTKTNWVMVKV